MRTGIRPRAVARELDFSPSFVSQIETGDSQRSVATLYELTRLLAVPLDETIGSKSDSEASVAVHEVPAALASVAGRPERIPHHTQSHPEVLAPYAGQRLSVQNPGAGSRLERQSRVVWRQLASDTSDEFVFIGELHPVGASATTDDRMLRRVGDEDGYLTEGRFEVMVEFDVFVVNARGCFGLDSSTAHLLRNVRSLCARDLVRASRKSEYR